MKSLLILITGLTLGLIFAEYSTVYRISCDLDKYGWLWLNQKRFSSEGFICRGNEKQKVQLETDPYIIYQILKLEMFSKEDKR